MCLFHPLRILDVPIVLYHSLVLGFLGLLRHTALHGQVCVLCSHMIVSFDSERIPRFADVVQFGIPVFYTSADPHAGRLPCVVYEFQS